MQCRVDIEGLGEDGKNGMTSMKESVDSTRFVGHQIVGALRLAVDAATTILKMTKSSRANPVADLTV